MRSQPRIIAWFALTVASVVLLAGGAAPAAIHEIVDEAHGLKPAKVKDNPQANAADIEGRFRETPNADKDEIRVSKPANWKGKDAGVYNDPVYDRAMLTVTLPTGPVKVEVEGREGVGAIYWVSLVPLPGGSGAGVGSSPGPTTLYADVQDFTTAGALILRDQLSKRTKSDKTDVNTDTRTLSCSLTTDSKSKVEFWLAADSGEFSWRIVKEGAAIVEHVWPNAAEPRYKSEKVDVVPGVYTLEVSGANGFSRKINFEAAKMLDVDIDSKDRWGSDYFTTDIRGDDIDAIKNDAGRWGKTIFVNDIEYEGTPSPGYICYEVVESSSKMRFVPLVMEVKLPKGNDLADTIKIAERTRMRFTYPHSPPSTIKSVTFRYDIKMDKWDKDGNELPPQTKVAVSHQFRSSVGNLRLWLRDGNASKNPERDFLSVDKAYNFADLTDSSLETIANAGGKAIWLYAEGINASKDPGDINIKVEVSFDDGRNWTESDALRATCVRSTFHVFAVRPYMYEDGINNRIRKLYTPDYSSPKAFLSGVAALYRSAEVHNAKYDPDPFWHEPDAAYGHGFCAIQYEGPPRGTSIAECKDSKYDFTRYFGKTGAGSSIYQGQPARDPDGTLNPRRNRSDEGQLAWFHFCPYEIEGKRLVVHRAWTVNPLRLNLLYGELDIDRRYSVFQLHIDRPPDAWGCMSNVGLAMIGARPPFEGFEGEGKSNKWYWYKKMPSTMNKSVCRVLESVKTVARQTGGKAGLEISDNFVKLVLDQTDGLAWEESRDITALTDQMFAQLQGKVLPGITAPNPLTLKAELGLNADTDRNCLASWRTCDREVS